jgi:hypothetical protein
MLDQNVAAEVLNRAIQTGGDFAEIFLEDNTNSYVSMKSDRIEAVGTVREHTGRASGFLKEPKPFMFSPMTPAGKA